MSAEPANSFAAARAALLRTLSASIDDARILHAFAIVPRERFVPETMQRFAYHDRPLPIGFDQTISQPTMIALMLRELELSGDERVLDVGTGSGYQAALLSMAREVVTVELIPELVERSRLALEGYDNVSVHQAVEELGWPAGAPYDAIVVAAAGPRIPQSLVDQLAMGGRLVMPVGSRSQQDLLVARRAAEGIIVVRKGACRFVPLVGKGAYAPIAADAKT